MNSKIVNVCGIVLVVLAVNASHDDCKAVGLLPPFTFGYRSGDDLNVMLYFENVSPDVFHTIYKTSENQHNYDNDLTKTTKTLYINSKKYCLKIKKQKLSRHNNNITIYLVLERNAKWCKNITILKGRDLYTNKQVGVRGYKYNKVCLRSSPCIIMVDLEGECTDSFTKKPQAETTTTTASDTRSPYPNDNEKLTPSNLPSLVPVPDINYFNEGTFPSNVTTSPNENLETTTYRITASDTTSTGQQSKHPPIALLIYVITTVIVMCFIILVIYISVKKYYHRNSEPIEAIELNTYATTNEVLYADLSLTHGDSQPPSNEEEATYAKIIGVIKPVDKTVKNK